MKRIDIYLLKETIPFAFIGFAFFTFAFILQELFRIVQLIIVRDVSVWKVFELLFYLLPAFFGLTVPIGILIGVLLGISRLSYDSELIALQANGISMGHTFRMVYLLGLVMTLVMIVFNDRFIPYGNRRYKQILYSIMREKPTVDFTSKAVHTIGDNFIIPSHVNPQTGDMKEIYIYSYKSGAGKKMTVARNGVWIKLDDKYLIRLKLENGSIIEPFQNKEENIVTDVLTVFQKAILTIDMSPESRNVTPSKSVRDKHIEEIVAELNTIEKKLKSPKRYRRNNRWREYSLELMKKFSIPFTCFVFAFLGAPLGITSRRAGRGLGIGYSIIIIFVWYILWFIGKSLAQRDLMFISIGAWLPNLFLLAIGIVVNLRFLRR